MKIDVVVPSYRSINPQTFGAILAMVRHMRQQGVDTEQTPVCSGGVIHWTRNDSMKLVRPDVDYVLFCDDDMLPLPNSAMRLLRCAVDHGVHVVSAYTTSRNFPVKISVKGYDPARDMFYEFPEPPMQDQLMIGHLGVGTGFVLMSKPVLDAVLENHLSARDWLEDNRRSFDRMKVRAEHREAERQKIEAERRLRLSQGERPPYFDFNWVQGYQLGEDISFCRRVLQLGHKIAVDTTTIVGHIGDFPYSPYNLGVQKPADLLLAS